MTFVNIYVKQVRNRIMYLVYENCIWGSVSNWFHMIFCSAITFAVVCKIVLLNVQSQNNIHIILGLRMF
jgi:hypothetical protein